MLNEEPTVNIPDQNMEGFAKICKLVRSQNHYYLLVVIATTKFSTKCNDRIFFGHGANCLAPPDISHEIGTRVVYVLITCSDQYSQPMFVTPVRNITDNLSNA